MNTKTALSVLLVSGAFLSASAAVRHLKPVCVTEGETIAVENQSADDVKSANPLVASAVLREKDVNVSGVGIGTADVTYHDARGIFADQKITVVPAYWEILKRMFVEDPEITIEIVGGKVVLSGATASSETLKRVANAKELDDKRIVSQVSYSPEALQVIVTDFLRRANSTNLAVNVVGREVCLSGKVYDPSVKKSIGGRVLKYLEEFPGVSVNVEGIQMYKQKIVIDLQFVEWNDTRARDLGLKGPDAITAYGDTSGGGSYGGGVSGDAARSFSASYGVGIERVQARLNLLMKNGVAKTMKSTRLATQSGEQVTFNNGGTLHMRVQGVGAGSSGDVKDINYGYQITAQPSIVDPETVNLGLDLDYSRKPSVNDKGDYEIERYVTKSKYVVKPGETIVLSGFDSDRESIDKAGVPFLSKIWGLQWLFGETNASADKTEMILVVTVDWLIEDSESAKARLEAQKSREVEVEMP